MAIKRIVTKDGRVVYMGPKGFARASDWVKENFDKVSSAKRAKVQYTELTTREKNAFNAQKAASQQLRFKGKFLPKILSRELLAQGYTKESDISNYFSRTQLNQLMDIFRTLPAESYYKDQGKGLDIFTNRFGHTSDVVQQVKDYMRRGYGVYFKTPEGTEHTGNGAVRALAENEDSMIEKSKSKRIRFNYKLSVNEFSKEVEIEYIGTEQFDTI